MASSSREDDDSDALEEDTTQQGIQQDEEIRKVQCLNKARIRCEVKERRKKLAERLTPRPKSKLETSYGDDEMVEDEQGADTSNQSQVVTGMLPSDIVNLLAAREKQVFLSDSVEEKEDRKIKPKKKKAKKSGVETVILKELPTSHCVQNSLEFLKKRKAQVPRTSAVLNNSNQALRLLSSGVLKDGMNIVFSSNFTDRCDDPKLSEKGEDREAQLQEFSILVGTLRTVCSWGEICLIYITRE